MLEIRPAGDSAVLATLGAELSLEVNRRVHRLAQAIARRQLPGIGEAVPGYATLLLHYDPLEYTYQELVDFIQGIDLNSENILETPRRVEIPVRYGDEFGPDLAHVAEVHGLSEAEVVRIHSGREYPVMLMGFTPGFPYLAGVDPAIVTPRLSTPRSLVPGGSVGIAGAQTGIYPVDSPGGWQIIGRTRLRLFDLALDPPFLLAPGDVVVFVPLAGEAA